MSLTISERESADHPLARKRGRPALNAPDQRADRREDIIKASSHLFFRTSYTETTLRRVAAEARVNVALIHYYFTSKQGLYQEVLTGALSETLTSLRRYQQDLPTPQQLIHALTEQFVAEPTLARTFLAPQGPPEATETVAKVKRRIRLHLHASLQTMHRTGRLPKDLDTDLLTSTILDLCWGPLRDRLDTKGDVTADQDLCLRRQIAQNTKVLEAALAATAEF